MKPDVKAPAAHPSPSLDNALHDHQPGHGTAAYRTSEGAGGETRQDAMSQKDAGPLLTDNFGHTIADNQNSLKAGARGPTLLEDFILREKIFHFDHERIPERIVHARGSGAHGVFECTKAIPGITKAAIFQKTGATCPVFVRFSTVAGGSGSVDTPRDVRGFAVKFYTEAGNWDLVGNNIPVFFIQDAIKFPDLVHAVKMEADRGYPQAASAHDTFWDFIGLMPEAMHMIMWAMSDRAIPRTLRNIEGFGVHTFRFVNDAGEGKFVKFHWKPVLGLESLVWDEAVKIAGADQDFHRRDLFEAIASGNFPAWDLGVQVFDEEWAAQQPYDVLDAADRLPMEHVVDELIRALGTKGLLQGLREVGILRLVAEPLLEFGQSRSIALGGLREQVFRGCRVGLGDASLHRPGADVQAIGQRSAHRLRGPGLVARDRLIRQRVQLPSRGGALGRQGVERPLVAAQGGGLRCVPVVSRTVGQVLPRLVGHLARFRPVECVDGGAVCRIRLVPVALQSSHRRARLSQRCGIPTESAVGLAEAVVGRGDAAGQSPGFAARRARRGTVAPRLADEGRAGPLGGEHRLVGSAGILGQPSRDPTDGGGVAGGQGQGAGAGHQIATLALPR